MIEELDDHPPRTQVVRKQACWAVKADSVLRQGAEIYGRMRQLHTEEGVDGMLTPRIIVSCM